MWYKANYDELTGLPNRDLFHDRLKQTIVKANRDGGMGALMFLDLDRFKEVNDTMGHSRGDLLLSAVARRLLDSVRKSETVARLGGDEFVILLTDVKNDQDAVTVANKIRKNMSEPFDVDGHEVFSSTSIGIVLYPRHGNDSHTLLRNADLAMYSAKARGRNAFAFFNEEMNQKAQERRSMESCLRSALIEKEFFLVYQPQIERSTGKMVGAEALLRWHHPQKGLIPPDQFIPIAEESGLIGPIGEWVLRNARTQAQLWQQAGKPPLRVAVNISGHQFLKPDIVDTIEGILAETGLNPSLLDLELTESILMEVADSMIEPLIDLKMRGVQLSIDDFGTGYSSLSYLKHFPINRIKIDRSFVRDITNVRDNAVIVEAIIAMARSLSLTVVGEGVETEEELDYLAALGCDEIQGYYFSKPVAPEDLFQSLSRSSLTNPLTQG
ncbi:MAG TPA: EAL domain-containing protein [Desulfopila sp.]|nr:EAL domain-containing protein [Desulfopila sp.]